MSCSTERRTSLSWSSSLCSSRDSWCCTLGSADELSRNDGGGDPTGRSTVLCGEAGIAADGTGEQLDPGDAKMGEAGSCSPRGDALKVQEGLPCGCSGVQGAECSSSNELSPSPAQSGLELRADCPSSGESVGMERGV